MKLLPVINTGPRRYRLGAEELIELGQTTAQPSPLAPVAPVGSRLVNVSKEEAKLMVRIFEEIVSFAKTSPVEFLSYCPPERWKETQRQVTTWNQAIQKQLDAKASNIAVPAEAVFRLIDLEKCISAARDDRIDTQRLAFGLAAAGSIANFVFGITWLGVPAYIAGLALTFGRPLLAKYTATPEEPYSPSISGDCEPGIGDHTDKKKVLERVIVSRLPGTQRHWWGTVKPSYGPREACVCLVKDRFRVRVEGWNGDDVRENGDWQRAPLSECETRKTICVWEPCGSGARETMFGPVPAESGHPETYWIEYVGPLTDGVCRMAGPFG